MIVLTNLDVYIFVFFSNITTKSKFELHTDTFDEFSIEELKSKLKEIFNVSNITPNHLQHKKIGPRKIEAYKKFRSEN